MQSQNPKTHGFLTPAITEAYQLLSFLRFVQLQNPKIHGFLLTPAITEEYQKVVFPTIHENSFSLTL